MPQVVVVGAGVFGTWTAHHLVSAGCGVTLVDAYGPANPRASSSDQSRILRCGYGADEIYSAICASIGGAVECTARARTRTDLASVRRAAAGRCRRPLRDRHQAHARTRRIRSRSARAITGCVTGIRISRPATCRWRYWNPIAEC